MSMTFSAVSPRSSIYSQEEKLDESINGGTIVIRPHSPKIWLRYWIHLLAATITGGIAILNFKGVYLMDVDDPAATVKLGAFQFAAKLHEVTILGSLVLLILDTVRTSLIEGSVPLGFLLSHVLFTDLDWLLSPQLWACMKPARTTLSLSVLIAVAIPFANLAGPLSAISMVPRLGWSGPQAAQVFPTFWNSSADIFWPNALSATDLPKDCFTIFREEIDTCPANVFRSIRPTGASNVNMLCTNNGPNFSCNSSHPISSTSESTSAIFRTMSAELDINSLTVYSSMPTINIFDVIANQLTSGIALKHNISDTQTIDAAKTQLINVEFLGAQKMFKPLVKASCLSMSYPEAYEFIRTNNLTNRFGAGDFTFIGDIDGSSGPKLLYTIDRRSNTLPVPLRGNCQGQDCFASFVCWAEARWAPLRLWYNTAQSTLLFQNDPQPKILWESERFAQTRPVTLRKEWLDTMVTKGDIFNVSEVWPFLPAEMGDGTVVPQFEGKPSIPDSNGAGQQFFQASNYTQALVMQFSIMLSQALAQVPMASVGQSVYDGNCTDFNLGFEFDQRICAQDPSHWIHSSDLGGLNNNASAAVFTVQRSGYRWGLDSILIITALSALLLHGLLTLIYVIYIITVKKQLTTKWASAPEILMLAINSIRAPLLMGHSTGTSKDSSNLWQQPVSIREMEHGQELSLIVGNPNDYRGRVGGRPVIGKKYA